MDNQRRPFSLHATLVALLFAALGIGGVIYGIKPWPWLPALASRHGAGIDSMLRYLFSTVGLLFLAGYLALAYFIWRGTRRTAIGRRFPSRRTEVVLPTVLGVGMAIIAEGGVLAIGMPVWTEYFDAKPPADAVTIEVTAQQFMWNVRYPGRDGKFGATDPALIDDTSNALGLVKSDPAAADDIVTLNEITVPVDRMVRIRLKSKDVIHSFYLPNLRVKQDTVPGMSPEIMFTPTATGDYEIACSQLCGLGHYRMRGFITIGSDEEFKKFLAENGPQQ
jgi:cytochrome c oxidase subunit 2